MANKVSLWICRLRVLVSCMLATALSSCLVADEALDSQVRRWLGPSLKSYPAYPATSESSADSPEVNATGRSPSDDAADQGEYLGALSLPDGQQIELGAQLVAVGQGQFFLLIYQGGLPGAPWMPEDPKFACIIQRDNQGLLEGQTEFYTARLLECTLRLSDCNEHVFATLPRVERTSPTLGQAPPADATILFDGRSVAEFVDGELTDEGSLLGGGVTARRFGSMHLHLEFRVPLHPELRGQGRSNSGIRFQERYEVQLLDSFGLQPEANQCGGIYRVSGADVNACLPPLSWQTMDIDFYAPVFDAANVKIKDARMTVLQNGIMIHHERIVHRATASDSPPEQPGPHPLELQRRQPALEFRNVWVMPLAERSL